MLRVTGKLRHWYSGELCVCVRLRALLPPTGESRDGAARSFSLFISLPFVFSSLNLAAGPLRGEAAKGAARWNFIGREPLTICSTRYRKWVLHKRCGQPHTSAVLAARLAIRTAACEPESRIDITYGDSSTGRWWWSIPLVLAV